MLAGPNLFTFAAADGSVRVSFSTDSIDSRPRFTYRDATHDHAVAGAAIAMAPSPLGGLATATLRSAPDGRPELTATLVLPMLSDLSDLNVPCPTFLVLSTHRDGDGPVQRNTVIEGTCTAHLVQF